MRYRLARIGLAALLGCGATLGCDFGAVRNKYPPDPLLLSKKPVEGKITGAGPVLVARAEPVAPPLPETALVSAPPLRKPGLQLSGGPSLDPDEVPPPIPDKPRMNLEATPAVRSGISSVVPASPAVRRRIAERFGCAPDYSWLQGVLEVEDGRLLLRYCDHALEDPWGGKVAMDDDPRLAAFKAGDVLMVEGEMRVQEGQPVFDSFRYPRYGVRSVWRVPETE